MRRSAAIGLAGVMMVAGGGCGGGGSGPGPLPKGQLVSLTRSGRAPFDDQTIVVRPDRHAIVSNRFGFHVTALGPATFESLRRDLHGAHFAQLSSKTDRIPAPDGYRYAITYRGHTVRRSEASIPAELKDAVKTLSVYLNPAPSARDIFLRVRRRGGFAPTDESVYVANDGRVNRFEGPAGRRERRFRMSPRALAALKQAVVALALADVPSSAVPPPADGYVYEVTADLHTIRAPQGQIAPPLRRVIALAEGRAYAASG
jgi:hypothetical protein